MCPSIPQAKGILYNPNSAQAIRFSPDEVEGFLERLRESKESWYALWLETFYPTNPRSSIMPQGVLVNLLQNTTRPMQRKVQTPTRRPCPYQRAVHLTTGLEWGEEERETGRGEEKVECKQKWQVKVKQIRWKKAAKNKGTAWSSKTAHSAQYTRLGLGRSFMLFKAYPNIWIRTITNE